MGCGCINGPLQSWLDIQRSLPENPLDLIAYATLGGAVGAYANSTNYGTVGGAWVATPWSVSGEPAIITNGPDSILTAALAAHWNFSHLTDSIAAAIAPPLRKVVFVRAGEQWTNLIDIAMGAGNYDDIQLSYRDNAGTRGDASGTVPVVSFAGAFTGPVQLGLVLKHPGRTILGLRARTVASGDYSMFELELNIVE